MIIIILTVNSKEIIDFINENKGIEILVGTHSFFQIEILDDIYYIWNNFTNYVDDNEYYLLKFRNFCENQKNFDLFLFYKPKNFIKYQQTYRMNPIFTNEPILYSHFEKVKNLVLNIFYDNSFVNVDKKLKPLENISENYLLQKLPGIIYQFNFKENNFKKKFVNALCSIS